MKVIQATTTATLNDCGLERQTALPAPSTDRAGPLLSCPAAAAAQEGGERWGPQVLEWVAPVLPEGWVELFHKYPDIFEFAFAATWIALLLAIILGKVGFGGGGDGGGFFDGDGGDGDGE